jgi:hypothetical protein
MASTLAPLLLASLSPDPTTRKQSESTLKSYTTSPNFLPTLLGCVLDEGLERSVRLAAGVFLKKYY